MLFKKSGITGWVAIAFATFVLSAGAVELNSDIPSCYAANKTGLATPAASREIYVLIDQTTLIDGNLRHSIMKNVGQFMKHGTAFTVATFSAFTQGRYMEVVKSGTLETDIGESDRNNIKVHTLENFDACIKSQWGYGLTLEYAALGKAMDGASGTLAKSDVESSIKALSSMVKISPVKNRVVLIVSDMLENSSISNFYSQQNVRKVDPSKEIAIAKTNGMIGDFGGARVYVIGAGIVGETVKNAVYRDPKTMSALKQFWSEYFKASNADLVEFGEPALMSEIR